LSGVLEIFMDESVQWRLPRILFSEREYRSLTLIRVLQGKEVLPGGARGLRTLLHLRIICHPLY